VGVAPHALHEIGEKTNDPGTGHSEPRGFEDSADPSRRRMPNLADSTTQ
jgi:hypothetical protein